MEVGPSKIFLLAVASLLGKGYPGNPPPQAGPIVVHVEGLRDFRGLVRLSLFPTEAGFPEDFRKAARTLSVKAGDSMVTVRVDSVPVGTWALAVLHDIDEDEVLDRNALGVPREGIGASNGAVRLFGPPRFRDARFRFGGDSLGLRVRLKYW